MGLFIRLRQDEILGLTWDCINLDERAILIKRQLTLWNAANKILAGLAKNK